MQLAVDKEVNLRLWQIIGDRHNDREKKLGIADIE